MPRRIVVPFTTRALGLPIPFRVVETTFAKPTPDEIHEQIQRYKRRHPIAPHPSPGLPLFIRAEEVFDQLPPEDQQWILESRYADRAI